MSGKGEATEMMGKDPRNQSLATGSRSTEKAGNAPPF